MAIDSGARLINSNSSDSGLKKISNKERTMILILAIVAITVLGTWFFLLPKYKGITALNEELDGLKSRELEYRSQIKQVENLEKVFDDARADYERYSSYFYELMEPELIDEQITGMLIGHGMAPAKLSMTLLETDGVPPYIAAELRVSPVPVPVISEEEDDGGDGGSEAQDGAGEAGAPAEDDANGTDTNDSKSFVYTVSVSAYGERDSLYAFLTQAAGMTAFEVTSFSISEKTDEGAASGAGGTAGTGGTISTGVKTAGDQENFDMEIKLYVFVEGVSAAEKIS